MTRVLSEIVVALSASPALSLLAKGTFVVALGLIGAWLVRRRSAAVRHALLASAFAVLLALPIVSFFAKPVPLTVPVAASDGIVLPLFDYAPATASGIAATGSGKALEKSKWSLPSLSAMLLYGWFFGTALVVIPIIGGLLQIRSLRRFGLPWRYGQSLAGGLAVGIHRRVEVLLHESLPGPTTCGVLHPVIFLPADAQSWDQKDLERAIVHELEHVRRYDWPIHCMARIACAAYWFHPLVWTAWRRLSLEAERSCDDAVLHSSEATAYADQLVGLARRLSAGRKSPALAMASRSDLTARVRALLDGSQRRGPVGALLIAATCITAAAIALMMSPLRMVAAPRMEIVLNVPQWETVTVRPCTTPVTRAAGERGGAGTGQSPDRIRANCATLEGLVSQAYNLWAGGKRNLLKMYVTQMEGFPEWASSEQYTIEARAQGNPGQALPGQAMMYGPMLQKLLEDRFRLKVHEEIRQGKVYILSTATSGPKMEILQPGSCTPTSFVVSNPPTTNRCPYVQEKNGNMGFDAWMTIDSLTTLLTGGTRNPESPLDAPILNKTGLTDVYHTRIEYSPLHHVADAPPADSIFTAMRKLGLQLETGEGPREYLVLDHAERPSED